MRKFQGPKRPESERQGLIAELRRLRKACVNVDRQDAIELTLRTEFELGWPERLAPHRRRPYAAGSTNGARGV